MAYKICLFGALALFIIGTLYRISNWFRFRIAKDAATIPTWKRITSAITGLFATLFSTGIFKLMKIFIMDVVFQVFFLKAGFIRWLAHFLIFAGFFLLLFTHALEKFIMVPHIQNYYSTVNPFMFMRNMFGFMVILGLGIVLVRRLFFAKTQTVSTTADYYAIFILAVIMISGFLLEAVKITSQNVFTAMVNEFSFIDENDTESRQALMAFWVRNYGLVSKDVKEPLDEKMLQAGDDLNSGSCIGCHARPQSAFMSYGVSRLLKPVAIDLDRLNAPKVLWYIHFLACFIGLAYLPFSKFFHIIATPVYLLARGIITQGKSDPANVHTLQAIGLDACVHCGECSHRCSVAIAMNEIPNPDILPSEKHAAFRSLLAGRYVSKKNLIRIQEGCHICTECRRCTDVCPVGIDLEELWSNLKRQAAGLGYPKPEKWARDRIGSEYVINTFKETTLPLALNENVFGTNGSGNLDAATFMVCFGCQNCTNACPVVEKYESPRKTLGLLPHEIMHCLALHQKELALGSMMLWDCLTCYTCQEQCPQGVRITDILYLLKNQALKQMKQEA